MTAPGRMLQRLYAELDLLAAQCLRDGTWEGLDPAGLAATASVLVYEARGSDGEPSESRLPAGAVRDAVRATLRQYEVLADLERGHRLAFLRPPDTGFAWAAYRWARGHRLEAVLQDAELTAGDFVRWCKQLVDLLGQVGDAAGALGTPAGTELARTAHRAVDALTRGVVTLSTL